MVGRAGLVGRMPTIYWLLDFRRAAHRQRGKAGQCERQRKQRERNHRDHDQPPWIGRISASDGGNMPNAASGQCDGHHKMVDCGVDETARVDRRGL